MKNPNQTAQTGNVGSDGQREGSQGSTTLHASGTGANTTQLNAGARDDNKVDDGNPAKSAISDGDGDGNEGRSQYAQSDENDGNGRAVGDPALGES